MSAIVSAAVPYRAPWWLPGGNLQTLYAALLAPRASVRLERERWDTPDGDFVDVDFLPGASNAPFVVLFHGLEGSARSHYVQAIMAALARIGWRGAVPHFRSCGGELNRLARAYHSGDSAEIGWMLERFHARIQTRAAGAPLFAIGVSLGGNALLKWLGERGDDAREIVRAAAAVSAPLDLAAGADAIERGFALLYAKAFLRTLTPKVLAKAVRHPGEIDVVSVRSVRTLREFDQAYTAPVHGCRDANDYYRRSSAKPLLRAIAVPTLVLNARNDPFLPGRHLPRPDEVSSCVTLETPAAGGHVGFVTGSFPGRLDWLPERIIAFFNHAMNAAR